MCSRLCSNEDGVLLLVCGCKITIVDTTGTHIHVHAYIML